MQSRRRWEVKIAGTLFSTESNFYADHASFPSSRASEETKLGAISTVKLREDQELHQEKSDTPRKAEIKGEHRVLYVIRKSRERWDHQKKNFSKETNSSYTDGIFVNFQTVIGKESFLFLALCNLWSAEQHINLSAHKKKALSS